MIVLNSEAAPVPQVRPEADAPAAPATPVGPARSRAALNLPGLCPLCGHDAVRKVLHTEGATMEAYRCPTDGEVTYHSGGVVRIGLDGRLADIARLVAAHPGAAAHFVGMGSAPIAAGA